MAGQQRGVSVFPNAHQRPQLQHRPGEEATSRQPSNFYFGPGSTNFNVHIYPGSQVYFNGAPHQGGPAQGGQNSASRAYSPYRNGYDMDYSYNHMEEAPPDDNNAPVNEVLTPADLASAIASGLQATTAVPPRSLSEVPVRAPGYSTPTLLASRSSPNVIGIGNGQRREQEMPVSGRITRRRKGRQWAP